MRTNVHSEKRVAAGLAKSCAAAMAIAYCCGFHTRTDQTEDPASEACVQHIRAIRRRASFRCSSAHSPHSPHSPCRHLAEGSPVPELRVKHVPGLGELKILFQQGIALKSRLGRRAGRAMPRAAATQICGLLNKLDKFVISHR